MRPLRKRPELLLAAAALLVAAVLLLAAGAKSALGGPDSAPQGAGAAPQNPFEAAQPGQDTPFPEITGADGSYVIGHTRVVVEGEPPLQPVGDETIPVQAGAPPPPQTAPPQQQQPAASYPVNLNTATQAQLETLPGIGPVKAQAILAWRAANGAFTNGGQLLLVNGIGEKTLEGMLPYITW